MVGAMLRRSSSLVVLAFAAGFVSVFALGGCPRPKEPAPPAELTANDRGAIARLEAQREAGVPRLIDLASDAQPERRALALRALGRVGSPAAIAHLRSRLTSADVVSAAAALGVAGAMGSLEPTDAHAIAGELGALSVSGPGRAVVLEALGRTGDVAALGPLSTAMAAEDHQVAIAAGLALGRLGRAKVALDNLAELAAIGRSKDDDVEIRYAATYALARGFVEPTAPEPAPTDPVVRALSARLSDSDAIVRATAVAGLGARRAVKSATPPLLERMADVDARVGVELVRVLGGPSATEATRAALVTYLAKTAADWSSGKLPAPFAHVVLEGLRLEAEHAGEPAVRAMILAIARDYADRPASGRPADRQRAGAWASCLALAALARPIATATTGDALADPAVAMAQLERCGSDFIPEAAVRALTLDAYAAAPPAQALRKIMPYANHPDQRIASAAIAVLPKLWKAAEVRERVIIRDAIAAGLNRPEPAVAGSAADAASTLLGDNGAGGDLAPVAAAVVARIGTSMDQAELLGSLLEVVTAAKLDAAPTCQQLRTHVNPTMRAAARTCVTALIGDDPGPAAPAGTAPTPPVDPSKAFENVHRWKLLTSQGEVTIELQPALAPWHVASIVSLTRNGFYDGLPFHRVVPDFVVQGGDPTGTGWGGPDYTLPAETGSLLDGSGYRVGGVGIADAGKDTGGSQWFAMTGSAPHLDGRYTWIGRVVDGADIVDRLQIGDTVIRARIE